MTENLLDLEPLVFDILKDYLNRNRPFHIEETLPFLQIKLSKKSVNLNNEGLRKILLSLIKKKMIVEGSTLSKDIILENSMRKKIHDYIIGSNGVLFNQIIQKLNHSNYVIHWHVKILSKFGLIQKEFIDNHYVFFNSELKRQDLKKVYLTSKKICKKIIEYLTLNDYGITKGKLASDLKIHRKTVEKYLELLKEIELIVKEKIFNNYLYFLKM